MSDEKEPHAENYIRRKMSYEFGVISPEHEADLIEGLCEGMVRANQIQIRAQPDAYPCCLGCGGYKYVQPENCRAFDWRGGSPSVDKSCQHVYGAWPLDVRKRGTCIDLACMLCAIYREKEDDRTARVIIEHQFRTVGTDANGQEVRERLDGQYHAMVMRGDGSIVDAVDKVRANTEQAQSMSVGQACDC
jgi:hypothetical protein